MQKGKCCPQGSWPALQSDYKPKGEKIQIGGTNVYHIGKGQRTIVIISDIFGSTSGRHQNIADTFAQCFGYSVYLPQILQKPYEGGIVMDKIMESIKNQNWNVMEERFDTLVKYLAEKGVKNFFVIGFCWGVWAAFKFALKYNEIIAIAGPHPSLGICGLFGQSQVELTKNIKCPAYLLPAGNDPANVKPGGEIVKILEQRFGNQKTGSTNFPQQIHGWSVRGDIKVQEVHRDVEKVFNLIKDYFAKF